MNKLLVLALITMVAQNSMAFKAPTTTKELMTKPGKSSVARPLETLALSETIIKIEKAGVKNAGLRTMVEKGEISAENLKAYADALNRSDISAESKTSIINILEARGSEIDLLTTSVKKKEAVQAYTRFVNEVAPALLKEGNTDVVDLLTTAGKVVVKEGGSVAIYRAMGTKFKIDGQKALDKVNELVTCKI